MPQKTRYESQLRDARWFVQFNPSAPEWSVAGGSLLNLESHVTADYPKWNYKQVISNGDSATTFLQGVRLRIRDLNSCNYRYKETLYTIIGTVQATRDQGLSGCLDAAFLSDYSGSDIFEDVNNRALMAFNAKCLSAQRSLQGFVAAGEIGESCRMIGSRGKKLRIGIDNYLGTVVKRSRSRRWTKKGLLQMLSDTWLEYSFGWRPLVADIQGAAKALAKAQHQRPARQFVTDFAGGNAKQSGYSSHQTFAGNFTITKLNEVRSYDVSVKYYGVIDCPLPQDFVIAQFGFRFEDFIPAVWELIPYSFLVDYFTNAGAIIEAFSHGNCGTRWVSRGIKTKSTSAFSNIVVDFAGVAPWVTEAVSTSLGKLSSREMSTVSRHDYTGTRIPALQFKIPGLSTKWLNIAALGVSHRRALSSLRV